MICRPVAIVTAVPSVSSHIGLLANSVVTWDIGWIYCISSCAAMPVWVSCLNRSIQRVHADGADCDQCDGTSVHRMSIIIFICRYIYTGGLSAITVLLQYNSLDPVQPLRSDYQPNKSTALYESARSHWIAVTATWPVGSSRYELSCCWENVWSGFGTLTFQLLLWIVHYCEFIKC